MKIGTQNETNREAWIKKTLSVIPKGTRILDAGAGESRYKEFCSHLNYVAQDFGKYDGSGDNKGLQIGHWNQTKLDIISDITMIPEPDASFGAILCTEVLEHLPEPLLALREFSRLLQKDGYLILTAPFCSLTHFAPFHFYSGFNLYFYQTHLKNLSFDILEIKVNGNYFDYVAQELHRMRSMAARYADDHATLLELLGFNIMFRMLSRFSRKNHSSEELLCFGYHILAMKR